MTFSNTIYDRLKFLVIIVFPAFAVLYLGLGQLWDWPNTDKVVSSVGIFTVFLGTLLQISTSKYKESDTAGYIDADNVDPDTGLADIKLFVRKHPEEILAGKTATFKVGPPPPMPPTPEPEEH